MHASHGLGQGHAGVDHPGDHPEGPLGDHLGHQVRDLLKGLQGNLHGGKDMQQFFIYLLKFLV